MMNLMCNMNSVCIDKWTYVLRVEHKDLLQGIYITMHSNDTYIIKCYEIWDQLRHKSIFYCTLKALGKTFGAL